MRLAVDRNGFCFSDTTAFVGAQFLPAPTDPIGSRN